MLSALLFHVFGFTTRWSLRAPGLAAALLLPTLVIAVVDWRVRSRR